MAYETLEIISAKDYQFTFNVCNKTAREWFNDDLLSIGRKRMTSLQFAALYKEVSPLSLVVVPKRVRSGKKR